jgi:hypothetical protein
MPTIKDINLAKRLMVLSQIESIRLMEARAVYVPQVRRPGPSASGGPLHVQSRSPMQRGTLVKGKGLRVLLTHVLVARRGPSPRSERALRIEGTFELLYSLPSNFRPKPEELGAFSRTNAMFNSWPYWREFVQSTVARMCLPPLTIPLFRVAPLQREPRRKG